jgi:alanyl-tRNA synthetase
MSERLYYHDSFLYEFDAEVTEVKEGADSPSALVLDQTAFYPTSGGQLFDTGWIVPPAGERLRITEVAEGEGGTILHFLENSFSLQKGSRVRGLIDAERRRDHMQQHSGQHLLSAVFVRRFEMPTVSFHMGADSCSIDVETKSLSAQQVEEAEALANEIVLENRPVSIRFVTQEEARSLGLRKIPPVERDELRLIDIRDFDLTACGGTHVSGTAQIGSILLRKTEKVRQGWRVEFVCGKRALSSARRDYTALAEAAGLLSSHIWDVPGQIRKSQEEARLSRKAREHLLEELADFYAARLLAETAENGGRRIIARVFPDRDAAFLKLLAQRLVRQGSAVVALLGTTVDPATLVFAQSAGQAFDMGALMREVLGRLGGRGGGSKDMAQGGPQQVEEIGPILAQLASSLRA